MKGNAKKLAPDAIISILIHIREIWNQAQVTAFIFVTRVIYTV
jgi:hypothetical protein